MISLYTNNFIDGIQCTVLSHSNYQNILNNPDDIARAERKLGTQAVVIYCNGHVGGYNTEDGFHEEWTQL